MTNNEKVIEWIEQAAAKISDFAVEQIPPFITEYLQWKFCEAAVETTLYFLIFLIAWGFYFRFRKRMWGLFTDDGNDVDNPIVLIPIIGTMFLIILSIGNFPLENIKDMIQISIAPKVYILEQASQLVKQQ